MAIACLAAAGLRPAAAQVNVYRLADMSFGPLVAGTSEQIQPTASPAGRFQVTAPVGAELSLTFTLPSSLLLGGSTLPTSFGGTDAAWSGSADVAAATRFDPRQPLDVTVPASGSVYVWIGGLVSASPTQTTGTHNGAITLSATCACH